MSVSYSSILNSLVEPNWAFVERIGSYVDYDERTGRYCALTDRYARKAQESDEDYLSDNDLYDAYDEGYLLDGMSQDDWDSLNDPFSYHDNVMFGPYLKDQNDSGYFTFQGPMIYNPGPTLPRWGWKPPGFTGEYYSDDSLDFREECSVYHRTPPLTVDDENPDYC